VEDAEDSFAALSERASQRFHRHQIRELGWRLAHHRWAKGFTRRSLAKRVGLAARSLAAIERGRANVHYATVLRLCDALDLPLREILGGQLATAPRTHDVQLPAPTWGLVDDGVQPFLLLRNDANYRPGDRIALRETLDGDQAGRTLMLEITYLLYGDAVRLAPGCVVAAIQPARDAWTVTVPAHHR
jgi:transcriptional regulator with XRE-family HTH domain